MFCWECRSLHTEKASQFLFDYSITEIANEKGIAGRIILCVLQKKILIFHKKL